MSVLEWKTINLLRLLPVSSNNKFRELNSNVVATCNNKLETVFCDALGNVNIFSKNWESSSFHISSGSILLCSLTEENLLSILIKPLKTSGIVIHIYDLYKLTKKNGAPCLATANLNVHNTPTVLSTVQYANIIIMAIGFENGTIYFYRAPICNDMSSNFRTISIGMRRITGIQFDISYNLTRSHYMFICATDSVYRIPFDENNWNSETKFIFDTKTIAHNTANCCTMHFSKDGEDTFFVVGRDDAIYCFTCDGRGPCFALEGKKKFISWVENNLIVVVELKSSSKTQMPSRTAIMVVDMQNKIIIFNKTIFDDIEYACVQNGSFMALTKNNRQILLLQERDITSKINLLIKQNMFDTALRITEKSGSDKLHYAAFINFQYGNFLLQKGETEMAVLKYIETIGEISPYEIIEKLLDSRHNKFLVQYLNILVQSKFATNEHKALLKSCRERLQIPFKISLDEFNCSTLDAFTQVVDYLDMEDDKKKIDDLSLTTAKLQILSKSPEQYEHLLVKLIRNQSKPNHLAFNSLLELYLRRWHKKEMQTNEILEFFKIYTQYIQHEDTLIKCRVHSFWPGINQILGSYEENIQGGNFEERHIHKYIQSLNQKGYTIDSSNINQFLSTLLKNGPQYLMQFFQNFSCNKNMNVLYVKEFFTKENFGKLINIENEMMPINILKNEIVIMKKLVSNFKENPIEFRNSICDICKQELKLPLVFYLCQHAFHKDCLISYTAKERDACIVCTTNRLNNSYGNESHSLQIKREMLSDILIPLSKGLFLSSMQNQSKPISNYRLTSSDNKSPVWLGRYHINDGCKTSNMQESKPVSKNPFENNSGNPFQEEYDSNLNPFE